MDTPEINPTPQATAIPAVNEAITEVKTKAKLNPKLLYGVVAVVVVLLAGAAYYAYSQGSLPFAQQPTTTSNSTSTPTVSSDVQSLDSTAGDVQNDLNDIDSINSDLNSIDTSNDNTPQL